MYRYPYVAEFLMVVAAALAEIGVLVPVLVLDKNKRLTFIFIISEVESSSSWRLLET